MKILFTKSGSSPYRVDFYNELGKHIELDVLYEYRIAFDRDKSWSLKKAHNFKEYFLKSFHLFGSKVISFGFTKYLKKDYDVIIVGEYNTLTGRLITLFLSIKKIPFALNIDGGYIKNDNWLKKKIKTFFISKATWWLSPSVESDSYLKYYGANENNIHRYPFTSVFEREILKDILSVKEKDDIKSRLGIAEQKVIITVGRFIKSKGFDILLKAFSQVDSETGLYIVGGEPTEEYLELIKEYNLKNVHFIEFLNKDELANYYKAADLFVLPTRKDVWGLVINEAMAFGLPIITTDKCVAGMELVENKGNGFIIPIEDQNELSKKMNVILSDNKLRNKMALNSLKKIKQFTIEEMAKAHLTFFNKIVKNK
ncbi:glycosyltransferase family 4 protein [Carnobacterium antarcticum]|uniref:Glycosyltransferase family 4 protein n=1 Tax=Carnobacterium antarcticum TaxID=2126436 RepID=A0ABW4NL53_9LACT|nr:glycosyltransferase family 4 protein [Carnobacterium sp. CP1]ALV21536.1 Glycosyltransferase [Carnobacterium sp. CP1]